MKAMIDILMSTYNGGRFVEQQIDSIIAQTFTDWRLLIRDDGSSDGTAEIVSRYADLHRERICLIESNGENLGACQSFARLLEGADADYMMFSDQDDVWLPDKIELTLRKMKEMEEHHGRKTPLLVFSDVTVVDELLNVIGASMWQYQKSDPSRGKSLNRLLLMNPANGCTMMVNRALRDNAMPVPPEAIMHDSWVALVASAIGEIGYIPTVTLLYRQHGRNESGTRRWGPAYITRQLRDLGAAMEAITRNRKQANALYQRYFDSLTMTDRKMLASFINLPEQSFVRKRIEIIRYGFFYFGIIRNIGWLILC